MRTVSIGGAAKRPVVAPCASTPPPPRIAVVPAAIAVPPILRKSRRSIRESYAIEAGQSARRRRTPQSHRGTEEAQRNNSVLGDRTRTHRAEGQTILLC